MFPGVIGRSEAMSRAGTITTAAASGWSMPRAAATAVARGERPAVARAIQPTGGARRGAIPAEGAEGVEEVEGVRRATSASAPTPIATSAAATRSGQSGTTPAAAPPTTSAPSTTARAAPRAAKAPPVVQSALAVREHAGEEADPDGVAGAERARRC